MRDGGHPSIRGVTVGPIESLLQPGRGYGSPAFAATLDEIKRRGANWISLTVFGRVWDARSVGIDWDFERPVEETRRAVEDAVQMAHARGLRVMLVPHLWLESGEWRAEMRPENDRRFEVWAQNYQSFVVHWAKVAESSGVDLYATGVELRSWVTSSRAPRFVQVIQAVREQFSGLLTYAANWDDAQDTLVWSHLDVVGINAFYQLHWENGATFTQLMEGGLRVRASVKQLAASLDKPVIFTEVGYTARANTSIEPWLWPEQLAEVEPDFRAQHRAYAALLDALHELPGFSGAFVWRMYADVSDLSQEPDWGFSPWGKPAMRALTRTFESRTFGDPPRAEALVAQQARSRELSVPGRADGF